jgi:site-specific DNA-adenine methylase
MASRYFKMRPFFSYYGAKYTVAKYAGPPRRDLVIEPFAGSAAYSTRYAVRKTKLYDLSEDICELWNWLIKCSEFDVRCIPDVFNSFDEIEKLPYGAGLLVRFWVSKGRAVASGTLSPWYFKYRNSGDCKVWGPAVKERIVRQKPYISEWTCENLSYEKINLQNAHWHVDPPYNNSAGKCYPFSSVNYEHLANWCQHLPGAVDVFENEGANWLPFKPLCKVVSSRGRRSGAVSREAMARLDRMPWET